MDRGELVHPPGARIDLGQISPAANGALGDEAAARARTRAAAERMLRGQDLLMAHETYGLVVLFQGMDTSGKDEAIRDVLSRLDPRGCEFKQFKPATDKEIRHDYLWRTVAALPARGQIGIFNRSYYEHVVVERVHPEHLERQRLPASAMEGIWEKRFRQINDFERYLTENGIHVLKFFLHISVEEQRRRLLERIERPETSWRFAPDDVEERARWAEYMRVYSEALTGTNTAHAPWYVVPGDQRWFAEAAVASVMVSRLESLHADYPSPTEQQRDQMRKARELLEREGARRR